jgi:hypothetical protein
VKLDSNLSFILVVLWWGGTFIDTFEADVLDAIMALFDQDPDPESFDEAELVGGCFKEVLPGDLVSLQEVDLLDERAEPGGGGFKELLLPGDLDQRSDVYNQALAPFQQQQQQQKATMHQQQQAAMQQQQQQQQQPDQHMSGNAWGDDDSFELSYQRMYTELQGIINEGVNLLEEIQ